MKKFNFLITALCVAIGSIAFSVSAFAEEITVIDDFNGGVFNVVWSGDGNVSDISITEDGCLEVHGKETDSTELKAVTAGFDTPILMDDVRSITARVFAEAGGADGYFVRIRLFGQSGEECEGISSIESGVWSEVSLDIAEWKHKEIVTGLEIGLIPEHTDSGVWTGEFLVDDVAAVSFSESETATRFLFDTADVYGGEIVFSEGGSYFELVPDEEADETVIEFEVNASSVAFADTLRLNIENFSYSDKMMVAFSDADSYARDIYTELETTTERRIYYIETGLRSPVKRVRLKVFGKGNIRFNGISLTDGYSDKSYITYGDITSARLSSDGKQIIITGEIPREYVTEFEGCELYLYALDLREDPKTADYDIMPVLSRHGISTKFTFRLDVGKQSGDALFKKYVVKISSTPKVFVDTPTYVSVGDIATSGRGVSVGYISPDPSGVAASASENGIVEICVNKLISPSNSGYMQAVAGKYYYFDKEYVDLIDSKISALYSSGASVTARLTVDGKELDGVYFESSADTDAYLMNVADERGYALVRAATEFLVMRYSDNRTGVIDSFVIGRAVNSGRSISSAPNMSLTDLVNTYANAMRLVYISAMNSGKSVRVYASVSDVYRNDYVVLRNNETDTELFVRSLGNYIYDEGYFPWGVCVEGVNERGGEYIKADNEKIFKSFLSDMSSFSGAAVMIVSLVTGDGAEAVEGLVRAAGLGFSGRYVFSDADGTHSEIVRALNTGDRERLESVGINTKAFGELSSSGKLATRRYSAAAAAEAKPEKLTGSYIYYDFNTHTGIGNFNSSFFAKSVRVAEGYTDTPVLLTEIDKGFWGADSGAKLSGVGARFDAPLSFSLTPVLSFDVAVFAPDGSQTESVDVIFRLASKNGILDYVAKVDTGNFSTVYIDLGKHAGEGFESLQVLVRENSDAKLELCVDNITGYSSEYNDSGLYQAINLAGTASDTDAVNRDLIAVIITVCAILLTVVASVVIIKNTENHKKRNN